MAGLIGTAGLRDCESCMARPTSFKPEYCEQAYKLCLLGATDDQIADFLGKSPSLIDQWKQRYPEFKEALHRGKTEADAIIAESLFHRAKGFAHPDVHISNYKGEIKVTEITKHYPPDTTACIFWLKNRQRVSGRWLDVHEFRGKIDHEHKHRVEGLSETTQWLESTLGSGTPAEDPVPRTH